VASPRLLQVRCKAPAEMKLVNGVARFVELGLSTLRQKA